MTKHRCGWCVGDDLYEAYHDLEWGVPVYDDHELFEFLILETFQAGLSWITVLRKRENYRDAFDNFKNALKNYKDAPANTPLSDTISKDLKKRGFKFVGSTVVYAFMQATGMVNDHEVSCFRYNEV